VQEDFRRDAKANLMKAAGQMRGHPVRRQHRGLFGWFRARLALGMPNGKNYNNKNTYYMDLSMVSGRLAQVRKRLTRHLTDGTFILHSTLTANTAVQEIPAESKLSLEETHPCRADGLRSTG
jgi:hypothetical protein